MEQSPKLFSTSQEIRRIICNPNITLPHLQVPATCPYPEPDQSISPNPTCRRSTLILSSHLCPGLPSGFFSSDFPTKTMCQPLLSPPRATYPAHFILPDLITLMIFREQYSLAKSTSVTKAYPSHELHIHNVTSCCSGTE